MKIKLIVTVPILFALLLITIPLLYQNSYGQETGAEAIESSSETGTPGEKLFVPGAKKIQRNTEILVQIVLRNSDGQLVGYVEGEPQIFYAESLIDWLEPRSKKSTIIKNGESFDLLQFRDRVSYPDIQKVQGGYFIRVTLSGNPIYALYFSLDSFPISLGDKSTIFVTVIR